MTYKVIESCCPYYIRFSFEGLQDIVNYALSVVPETTVTHHGYTHEFFSKECADKLFSMLPMSDVINFKRASIFTTPPDGGCGAHKDGIDHKVSFNIPLQVLDNNCETYWYTDHWFLNSNVETHGGYTRNAFPNWRDLNQFVPSKTMVAQPGEMILFNTDIYHAWHNNSVNTRRMIVLRSENPEQHNLYQVKKILGV